MKYKRLLCLGLAAALSGSALPGELAYAKEPAAQESPAPGQDQIQGRAIVEDAAFQYEEMVDGTLSVAKVKDTAAIELVIPAQVDGKKVGSLGAGAFQECTALKKVTFPSGVQFGGALFFDCDSLEEVVLAQDDPNYIIEEGVLYDRQKETLIFCSRAKSGSLALPGTITEIDDNALKNCAGLTEVTLPDSLTLIGGNAFMDCKGLTQVTLPKAVEISYGNPFWGCEGLESIVLDAENPHYTCQDDVLYNKDMTELICFPGGKGGDFEIPESVLKLRYEAFFGCRKLASIRIPARMGIGNGYENYFADCDALTEISVDASNPNASSKGKMLFDFGGRLRICPAGIKNAVIPDGTRTVAESALASAVRETVQFPASVKKIEGNPEDWGKPFVMIVPEGSYAETYAKEHGIEFRYTEGSSEETGNIDGFDYKKLSDGSLEITGYTGEAKEVEVPSVLGQDPVSQIGFNAFYGRADITGITLPEGVTLIGSSAFAGCTGLKEVKLPQGLEVIRSGAFSGCSGLAGIGLPEGLEQISDDTFRGCASLKEMALPRGISIVGERSPFMECYSLERISIAEDDLDYQCIDGALYDKGKTELLCCPAKKEGVLQLPGTVTVIADNALQGCGSLTEVSLPEGLLEIGDFAFDGCSSLAGIELPDSLADIGLEAFRKCTSFKQVNLPANAKGCENKVFNLCSQLERITVDAGNPEYTAQDGILYNKGMTKLIYVPAQVSGSYAVPESVTEIGIDALDNAVSLEEIRIHKGVQTGQFHTMWNTMVFCSGLKDIVIEEGHPDFYSKDGMVYAVEGDGLEMCPGGRMEPSVPEGTPKIGAMAFSHMELEFGTPIPREAITVPASVKEIQNLRKEYVKLMIVEKESYAETYAKEHEIPYRYTDGTGPDEPGPDDPIEGQDFLYRELGDGTLEITGYQGEKTELSIPSKLPSVSGTGEREVARIGERAFADRYDLKKVELPQGIAYIGKEAFQNCISLTEVSRQAEAALAEGEEAGGMVGDSAFQNCIRLVRASLPEGITSLGSLAFQGCTSLRDVSLPGSLESIGQEAFGGCRNLPRLVLPGQVAEIGSLAFQGCSSLAELTLPDSLVSIGRFAFVECTRLSYIALPERLGSIGYNAFEGCPENLVLGVVPGSYAREYAKKMGMEYRYTKACAHSYTSQVTKEPTCTQAGERVYTCTICEESYQEPVAATGHSYKTTVNKPAPQKDGSIIQECAACGDKIETKIAAIKGMSLSKTEYTYNGKAQKPGVSVSDSQGRKLQEGKDYAVSYPSGRKNPGKYTVTVRFMGNYSGTLQSVFTIFPKGTSISKVTAKKNGFTVKWKKQASQISSYEIQYSTSKKFTKKATTSILGSKKAVSKGVSKLKAKKKYYIRIRTFKNVKVSGKDTTLFSSWSKVKSVTTKK